MRKKFGDPLASVGAVIGVWAVVLLVWTFYIELFPSADYELKLDDESVSMTGKRGETISILFELLATSKSGTLLLRRDQGDVAVL